MQEGFTSRLFGIVEWSDRYNQSCSLQESSLATEETIWLGTVDHRMHLTKDMVAELMPYLQRFLEKGIIVERPVDTSSPSE